MPKNSSRSPSKSMKPCHNPSKKLGADVEQKVRQVIQGQLNKLDVVSREEFDVQTQVLLRTRQKLTELEQKMAELEAKLADK